MATSASDLGQSSRMGQAIEKAVEALGSCSQDAVSEARCRGLVDPEKVVRWLVRAEGLLRFRFERSELRVEIPAVAEQLLLLLDEVTLPLGLHAEEVVERFVAELPSLRRHIAQDVVAAYDGDPSAKGLEEIVVSFPSIRALATHRISHELYRMDIPLLPRIMSEYAHDRTGIDIHPGARVGERFFIDHGTGVVIGETAIIGDGVRLYQGVTVGATSLRDRDKLAGAKRHPTIEDNVTIYAGATILGGETVIGHDSIIGGNVWLTSSVPPGSRVLAEPARQLVHAGAHGASSDLSQIAWDF